MSHPAPYRNKNRSKKKSANRSSRERETSLKTSNELPCRAQNECRIPIRTSACVCVVDGVKL